MSDPDAEVGGGRLKLTGEAHASLPDREHVDSTSQREAGQGRVCHPGLDRDGDRGALFVYSDAPPVERWRQRMIRRGKLLDISFTEFAVLTDSRRYVVRNDRGFSRSQPRWKNPWLGQSTEVFAADVRRIFGAYELDRPTVPEWIVERLRRVYGIDVDPISVGAALRVPLLIEFGPRLLALLPESD
ncbi:MAG: hypothetical protein OXE79_10025 [Acidimicrobiaceae bacterium]|nr:hypothetical protein [Acidimicrobiaceae bacterium]